MVNGVTIIDFWCCSTLLFIEVTYSNKFFSNKTWLCSWKCKRKRNFCKISLCAVLLFQYRLRSWRNRGNMKKKCARLIFIEGEKNGETFNRRCNFWNVVLKGGLSLFPSLQREILYQLYSKLWLKRYWSSKWQNIRKFFRLSSFRVNNNSGSNSSSNNHCLCI